MIASLPMYWRQENAMAWWRLWTLVRETSPGLPPLTPPEDLPQDWMDHWRTPDLALSQTCGLPFRAALHGSVDYVGTLDFDLPDTPPGHYQSFVLTHTGEDRPERDLRLAYNSADSQSGWAATDGAPFAVCIPTGAHRASAEAVAQGAADVAFVDAVTWRLVEAYDPDLAQRLTVRRRTRPTPGLPLIAARGSDLSPLREGISHALDRLTAEDRRALGGPRGLVVLEVDAYLALPIPAPPPV